MGNEQNYNETLGGRLSKYRKKYKLSQQALADMVGYSSFQSISNIENDKQPIKKDMAKQFARIFSIDENYFLDLNIKYPTQIDKFNALLNETSHENYLMFNAICSLAALNGYDVEIQDIHGSGKIEDVSSRMKEFMIFKRNGKKEFSLSLEDANRFGNNLSEIFMSNIKWNIKTE